MDDQDNRGETKQNNWVWYIILGFIVVLMGAMFVMNNAIYRLKYPYLLGLLEEVQYDKVGGEKVNSRTSESGRTVPLSR